MNALRIGVDARPLQHPHSGIGRYTKELLTAMMQSSPHHWYLYSTVPVAADLPVTRVTNRCLPGPSSNLWSTFASQLWFPRWAAQDQLSVFWAPRHHLPWRQLPMPTLVTIHDMVWSLMPKTMPWAKAQLERLLMPRSLKSATTIIAVSESTKQDIVTLFPSTQPKVTKILEASSLHELSRNAGSGKSGYILSVGTFEPRKNIERSIAGYATALAKEPNLPKLLFAGNPGWNQPPIKSLIQQHQMQDQIEVITGCSDQELADLYANCLFLLHPALYEGFALPIVEAMAFGKPVIASNCSSMPEVMGSAGLLIDPLDINSIANAIQRLGSDEALRQRLQQAASTEAARFSWSDAAKQTLAIIEQGGSNANLN